MPEPMRPKKLPFKEQAVFVHSDEERDEVEVSFVGSTRAIKRRQSAIVLLSDTDSEDDRLPDIQSILQNVAVSVTREATVTEARPSTYRQRSISPLSAENAGASSRKAKKIKANVKVRSSSPTSTSIAQLSKEDRQGLREKEQQERRLAREMAKAAKEAEKSFQKKVTEVNRLKTSKNDTVREIRLFMSADMALPTSPIAGALPEISARYTESLSEINFMSEEESPMSGVIRIKRHVKAKWDVDSRRFLPVNETYWEWENAILVVVSAEEIVDKIIQGEAMLVEWIQDCRMLLQLNSSCQIVVIIRDLGKYRSKTKTMANREFTAMARAGLDSGSSTSNQAWAVPIRATSESIDLALVDLQVQEKVFILEVEKTEEMEDWVWNLTADIALRPYKLLSKSHLSFAPSDSRRKATSANDALELMLQEVQGLTSSAAAGIAAEYPTFADLMRAFQKAERRGGVARAESMLEDCQIKNLKNGTATSRKLNKALSRRVYQVFRGQDSLALA